MQMHLNNQFWAQIIYKKMFYIILLRQVLEWIVRNIIFFRQRTVRSFDPTVMLMYVTVYLLLIAIMRAEDTQRTQDSLIASDKQSFLQNKINTKPPTITRPLVSQ